MTVPSAGWIVVGLAVAVAPVVTAGDAGTPRLQQGSGPGQRRPAPRRRSERSAPRGRCVEEEWSRTSAS